MSDNFKESQMKSLTPVRHKSLRAEVVSRLRDAIVSGELLPGQKLTERDLSESLSVSRPLLREALRSLEAEKLIVVVPHRGPEVATISQEEAREIYALRALVEGFAAHEFALRASDAAIRELADAVEHLRKAVKKQSRIHVLDAKASFYHVLAEGCGNRLIVELLNSLLARISLLRSTSLMDSKRLPQTLDEMEILIKLIQSRDAEGAERQAKLHVRNAEAVALDILNRDPSKFDAEIK